MAHGQSINNNFAKNEQNKSIIDDINDIRSEYLLKNYDDKKRIQKELEIVLFLGGYTDVPKQIANIKTFLDENPNTILIILDENEFDLGFKMTQAFSIKYASRIFYISNDIYDSAIWKLFKDNNVFFNKIISDYSVIHNNQIINYINYKIGRKIIDNKEIDNLLKFIYICLADNGLLYLYDISLTDGFALEIINENYRHYGFKIEKISYDNYPIQHFIAKQIPDINNIVLCAEKSVEYKRIYKLLNGGYKSKSRATSNTKSKTKRKYKSRSKTRTKSRTKTKSKTKN